MPYWLTFLVLVLSAVRSWGAPAAAYTFVDLGQAQIVAQGADDEQAAVGTVVIQGLTTAVVLRANQPPQVLGTLPAGRESEAHGLRGGRVVGQAAQGPTIHAVRFEAGGVVDLGTLEGAPFSSAACLSAAGDSGGFSLRQANHPPVPVRWSVGGALQVLATLGGAKGLVEACNGQGDVAGLSETTAGPIHATLWRPPDYAPQDIQTLPIAFSRVLGLSDTGDAVGLLMTHQGVLQGFHWTTATGMVVLPALTGDLYTTVRAVNAAGDRVGRSWSPDLHAHGTAQSHAVLWGPDGLPVELQRLVPAGTPWPLREAIGIGPHGGILVIGEVQVIESEHARPQGVAGFLVPLAPAAPAETQPPTPRPRRR